MLALFINGNHIGDLRDQYAYKLAEQGCANVGDVVCLYTVDPYDHYPEQCVAAYYRNTKGVQTYHNLSDMDFLGPWMWDDQEKEPTTNYKLRDKMYAKTHTSRSYAESDNHRYRLGSQQYMSFIKRQERKAARKLGKLLILEHLAA